MPGPLKCALVLIGYQNEMVEVIRSETPADLGELHVRLLAKTARAYGMPIVLSTVGVKIGFNGSPRWSSARSSAARFQYESYARQVPGLTVAETTGT